MIFNKSGRIQKEVFSFDKEPLKTVKSHTYLGIELCTNGSFGGAIDTLHMKATKAMFKLRSVIQQTHIAPRVALHLFNTAIKPLCRYGCEVWGPCFTNIKMFEKTNNIRITN